MKLLEKLKTIEKSAIKEIIEITHLDELEKAKVKYLGRKGALTSAIKGIKSVAKKDKPKVGRLINELKQKITALADEKEQAFREKEQALFENNDITLPGIKREIGHRHPLIKTRRHYRDIC